MMLRLLPSNTRRCKFAFILKVQSHFRGTQVQLRRVYNANIEGISTLRNCQRHGKFQCDTETRGDDLTVARGLASGEKM